MIKNPECAKQIIDFSDLPSGATDIDGLIENTKKSTVIILEYKYENAEIPKGQKIALTEVTKALKKTYRKAYALHCSHHVGISSLPVDAGAALVKAYYNGNKSGDWVPLKEEHTVKEFVEFLIGES